MVKNTFFQRMGLEIFFLPTNKKSGVLDALLTLEPDGFHRVGFSFKNIMVSLLPKTPNKENRD